jgi:short subunit dehydrogenase-like uncharacterized protein
LHFGSTGRPRRFGHNGTILIYGATGYTGKLVAKAAADQGARPILAGRKLAKVNAVARPLGLKALAIDLGDVPVLMPQSRAFRWCSASPVRFLQRRGPWRMHHC